MKFKNVVFLLSALSVAGCQTSSPTSREMMEYQSIWDVPQSPSSWSGSYHFNMPNRPVPASPVQMQLARANQAYAQGQYAVAHSMLLALKRVPLNSEELATKEQLLRKIEFAQREQEARQRRSVVEAPYPIMQTSGTSPFAASAEPAVDPQNLPVTRIIASSSGSSAKKQPATQGSQRQIALLIPLSGPNAKQGEEVQQGFMAAYAKDDASKRSAMDIRVYDSEKIKDHQQLYQLAKQEGADIVIEPLGLIKNTKKSYTEIGRSAYRFTHENFDAL